MLDLSAFELVDTYAPDGTPSFQFQADPYQMEAARPTTGEESDGDHTPGEERPRNYCEPATTSDRVIPCLPVLGAAEVAPAPIGRNKVLPAEEQVKLAAWLKENPNGKVFEKVLPSWFRSMLPPG